LIYERASSTVHFANFITENILESNLEKVG
jgi:hypothetical protein